MAETEKKRSDFSRQGNLLIRGIPTKMMLWIERKSEESGLSKSAVVRMTLSEHIQAESRRLGYEKRKSE